MAYYFITEIFLFIYVIFMMFMKFVYNKNVNSSMAIITTIFLLYCCAWISEAPIQSLFTYTNYELSAKFIILAVSLLICHCISEQQFDKRILLFTSLIGALIAISSTNFILLLLCTEIAVVPVYISVYKDTFNNKSYITYGVLGSVIFIVAVIMIYMTTGYISFGDVRYVLLYNNDKFSHFIFVITLIAFCIKLGIFFVHFWIADVLERSPTLSATVFCILRTCIILVFYKIISNVFCNINISYLISLIACISILCSSFALVSQTKIKKIIAYAITYHSGIVLLCCSVNPYISIQGIIFSLISEVVALPGILIFISNIKLNQNKQLEYITDFQGLALWNPYLSISVSMLFLSFLCFPPLIGFWGGYYICVSLLKSNSVIETIIYVISIMVNLICIGHILKAIWTNQQKKDSYFVSSNSKTYAVVYFIAFMTVISVPIAKKIVSSVIMEININE